MEVGIYQQLFELLHTYVYGGVELTADMNLTLTIASTAGALFLVSLPFILVWGIVKIFR